MFVVCSAIRPLSESFPGKGNICMTWMDGAIEFGISVSRPGTEKFITPN